MEDRGTKKFFVYFLVALFGVLSGLTIASYLKDTVTTMVFSLMMFILFVSVYSILRIYLSKQRRILRDDDSRNDDTEVDFVVDTFHELVSKLKEKERELARLKVQAEERAGRIEAYSENILQSIPSGVISIDNDMRIKSINHSAEHILGVSLQEAIGLNFVDVFGRQIGSLLQGQKSIARAEYPYTTRDGRHLWLGITTSQLKNRAGEVIGMLFIFTDLTDIKALQEEIKLKERLSQLGEMSAGIAHELRNSMSVISGYARLLSRSIDDTHRSSVESILSEIKGMDRIISELLSFAKPTILSRTTVDLNKLVEETVRATACIKNSIKLSIKTANNLSVEADETLLRQAITNLIVNAVDSMPEGGMLEVETSLHGEMAIIRIKDTGKGIADDIKDKIFLPFFSTKEKGTGLGLALVQKIVVAHNGRVEFESKAGEGTVFKISLPSGRGSRL
jgi:PAS domain S-box-containing protein